jgi:hypothetical protein
VLGGTFTAFGSEGKPIPESENGSGDAPRERRRPQAAFIMRGFWMEAE